jgi:hypothetical protein
MSYDQHTMANAPRPWIVAHAASEIAAVCDAQGRRLLLCRNEIAQVIVEAVNKLQVEA